MDHQGEEKQAQDASLRGAGAQSDDGGVVVSYLHRLGPVREEVQEPVTNGGTETQGCQFAYQVLRDDDDGCFSPPGVAGSGVVQRRWCPLLNCSDRKQTGTG